MSKYINPYTDFGFKKLFGEEANKDLLIDFLNTLLPAKHQVKSLSFRNPEFLGATESSRRAVFDIFCEAPNGEQFIVEMQKAEQENFIDRSIYYTAHPIREQGQKGKKWNFQLKAVYFIGILDFVYDKNEPRPVLIREVSLKDQFGKEFYDKLQMIYIQMPLFEKSESELSSHQDKWLYFLKNLPSLDHIPQIMKEKVFKKAFHTAEVSAMSPKEQERYEQDLNDYWTYWATIDTAENKGMQRGIEKGRKEGREKGRKEGREEGRKEGRAEGEAIGVEKEKLEIARNMKTEGFDTAVIIKMTGLSLEEIEQIR